MSDSPTYLILLGLWCVFAGTLTAQDTLPSLLTETFRAEEGVRLRWWATDPYIWALGRERGYLVERREVLTGNRFSAWTTVNEQPLLEANPEVWRELVRTDSINAIYPSIAFERGEPIDYVGAGRTGEDLLSTVDDRVSAYVFVLMGMDMSYPTARAAGLGFVDSTALTDRFYDYRIRMAGEGRAYTSANVRVVTRTRDRVPEIRGLTGGFGDGVAELRWPEYGYAFRSYDVYRRPVASDQWNRVNDSRIPITGTPGGEMTFTDSLPEPADTYEYAIRGYSPFGESSGYSNRVSITPDVPEALPEIVATVEETSYSRATIAWSYPRGDSSGVDYIEVFRSYEQLGGRQRIAGPLPPEARSISDTLVENNQFYTVRAYDRLGRYRSSLPVHVLASDTIAPPPPTGISGEVDTAGLVTLTWSPSRASDVIGYRVFYSNSPERAGNRITDSLEVAPRGRDTLSIKSLPDTVYYRVVALDERENVSGFSAPFALALPDLLPPDPPRLRSFTADTNGIVLTYAASSSDDVASYRVERRAAGTGYWQPLAEIAPAGPVDTFTDDDARSDLRFEYRIIAFDEAGLRGTSNSLTARSVPRTVYPAVAELSAESMTGDRGISLTWVFPVSEDIRYWRLLRAPAGGTLTTYRTLERDAVDRRESDRSDRPTQWRFVDDGLRRDRSYVYAVQAVYFSGALGRLGEPVTIDY